MELMGKKVVFLGDSITNGTGTSGIGYRFSELMEKEEGIHAVNLGIGGTRIAMQPGDTDRNDKDFCFRVKDIDPYADIVVIFGGTNDFGHGLAPIGKSDDRDASTFIGALHYLFSSVIERCPDALIVVLTPLHRLNEDDPKGDCKPDVVLTLSGYTALIREIAEYYSLPVLDLWSVSGLQPKVGIIREKYMPDGLHPNDCGHKRLALLISDFLKNL